MIPAFRNLPLSIKLVLIGCMFIFSYLLFPLVALCILLPFYGMDGAIGIFSGHFASETDKYAFLAAQFAAHLGTFGLTAMIIAQLETRFTGKWLALDVNPTFKLIVIALIAVLVAQPFIQLLVDLMQKVPLPHFLKSLTDQEKQQEEIMNGLLGSKSVLLFLANTVTVAIEPAFAEELFFRAALLGLLLKSKVNPAVAIITTGFLFSIAHVEVDNLLAIWMLGAFLGYLYYISGSIWLSFAAHFANNFLVVLLKYIYTLGLIKADITEADIPIYASVVSLVLFALCLLALNKWRRPVVFAPELNEQDLPEEGEEHYI